VLSKGVQTRWLKDKQDCLLRVLAFAGCASSAVDPPVIPSIRVVSASDPPTAEEALGCDLAIGGSFAPYPIPPLPNRNPVVQSEPQV
jgi:hypothetical protein